MKNKYYKYEDKYSTDIIKDDGISCYYFPIERRRVGGGIFVTKPPKKWHVFGTSHHDGSFFKSMQNYKPITEEEAFIEML